MAFNIECFWLTSSKTFHQLQYLVRTIIQKKSNLRHIENQTSNSTLLAFVCLRNSRGRYGETTIKNELTLYEMLDSY